MTTPAPWLPERPKKILLCVLWIWRQGRNLDEVLCDAKRALECYCSAKDIEMSIIEWKTRCQNFWHRVFRVWVMMFYPHTLHRKADIKWVPVHQHTQTWHRWGWGFHFLQGKQCTDKQKGTDPVDGGKAPGNVAAVPQTHKIRMGESPAEAIIATTAGRSPPEHPEPPKDCDSENIPRRGSGTITPEGKTHPSVATIAPGSPAIWMPTKVAGVNRPIRIRSHLGRWWWCLQTPAW